MGSIVPIPSQLEARSELCIWTPNENEICSLVILLSLYLLGALDFSFCERILLIFGTCKLLRWWGNLCYFIPHYIRFSVHSFIYNNSNQVFGLLLQAKVTISKLTEERRSSIQDIKVLQEKFVTSWPHSFHVSVFLFICLKSLSSAVTLAMLLVVI